MQQQIHQKFDTNEEQNADGDGSASDNDDESEITFTFATPAEASREYDVHIWTPDSGRTRLWELHPREDWEEYVDPEDGDEDDGPSKTYLHHVNAVLHDDPHRVFEEDNGSVVHHKSHREVDAPTWVEELTRSAHHALHQNEEWVPDGRGIPIRCHAETVDDEDEIVPEPDPLEEVDLSRFALPPRADSPIHGEDDEGQDD